MASYLFFLLQIDLHRDISGFLSALPHTPLLTLHHIDAIDPIFPSINRPESVAHLMKAAKVDQSRLLQQSVCYFKRSNWTFSVSWGYSVQIYEDIIPPSILHKPIATFIPWKKGANPPYMFNARPPSTNPCEAPHALFFGGVEEARANHFVTSYTQRSQRGLGTCSSSGNHSAEFISKIYVLSPMEKLEWVSWSKSSLPVLSFIVEFACFHLVQNYISMMTLDSSHN